MVANVLFGLMVGISGTEIRKLCLSRVGMKGEEKMSYLDTTHELYKEAALKPQSDLCCVSNTTRYQLDEHLLLESLELVAYKNPVPMDGACSFIGETVIYFGQEETQDDGRGHLLQRDIPLPVCQKTAAWFRALEREDVYVTEPTYHYADGGCC